MSIAAVVAAIIAALLGWLKFVHDPSVKRRARLKGRLSELDVRAAELEDEHAAPNPELEGLEAERERLRQQLETMEVAPVDDAIDRINERFGGGGPGAG